MKEPCECGKLKSEAHTKFDEGIVKVELLSYVCYGVLSGRKFDVWDISSDLRPSGLVNMIKGPKQVILAASGEGWVEQSPLGVSPFSATHPGSNSIFVLCYCITSV